jgi:DNA-binding NtrC family response regulator
MEKILIVSGNREKLKEVEKVFSSNTEYEIFFAKRKAQVIDLVKNNYFALVVCDESTADDFPGKDLIEEIIKINAMINTALVSTLSDEDFHEFTEGLGILKKISPNPSDKEAKELYDYFQMIINPGGNE